MCQAKVGKYVLNRNSVVFFFSIADDGIGIDESAKDKIFERFYQNDSSRTASGNGIGLAIVKRIIELYEGTIEVQSVMHLIVKVPVFLSDRTELVPVEIQFRTIAMDYWASLELSQKVYLLTIYPCRVHFRFGCKILIIMVSWVLLILIHTLADNS